MQFLMRRWTRFEVLELAKKVLEREGKPLTEMEIWKAAKTKGYDKGIGRPGTKPWMSIRKEVNEDIRYNKDTIFTKVGRKPRKISLLAFEKVHAYYCRKLAELGKALGYDTDIPRGSLFHLACPDSVWYVDTKIGFRKVPIVAFEVLCSESEKAIRGSLSSLMLYGSPRSVLVLVTREYRRRMKSNTIEEWRAFITRLIGAFGLKGRVFLWDEATIDDLLDKCKAETTGKRLNS